MDANLASSTFGQARCVVGFEFRRRRGSFRWACG